MMDKRANLKIPAAPKTPKRPNLAAHIQAHWPKHPKAMNKLR